ncbi:hypothetical protein O7622_15585 [Micromonospora sp. WMMD1076]|uniref:hypothetical protein n=1 Tax=Micromonospora TaxID=1873 RepID=UPI00249A92FF|nr:hypothetical protein [Micromonospora sp. WMMD1076]WFF04509.1 hypothetical protein O7622_15585 [Micromonospora sp. WMMD1076]
MAAPLTNINLPPATSPLHHPAAGHQIRHRGLPGAIADGPDADKLATQLTALLNQ